MVSLVSLSKVTEVKDFVAISITISIPITMSISMSISISVAIAIAIAITMSISISTCISIAIAINHRHRHPHPRRRVVICQEGVHFQSPVDGTNLLLTPEKSIQLQNSIGADIIMALDDVVSSLVSGQRVVEAMHRTLRWIDRCIEAHQRPHDQVPTHHYHHHYHHHLHRRISSESFKVV